MSSSKQAGSSASETVLAVRGPRSGPPRKAFAAIALICMVVMIEFDASRQSNPFLAEISRMMAVVTLTCAVIGNWLVLRRMAMMADAIAHAILFGIVGTLWLALQRGIPLDLGSSALVVGAAGAGLLTVFLTERLIATGLVKSDAAMGIVFTFLFALALVLISSRFEHAHVDEHLVLAGGVENTVFRRLVLAEHRVDAPASDFGRLVMGLADRALPDGMSSINLDGSMNIHRRDLGPKGLFTMLAVLVVGSLFVTLFWKELKISTFDPALAASLGFSIAGITYALMSIVSVAAVAAFEAVGSIIVIAFFVAPPATARLLTHDLLELHLLSSITALLAAWSGFHLAIALDANFGGSAALASGCIFAIVFLLSPQEGLITVWRRRRRQRQRFEVDILLVHLAQHLGQPEELIESRRSTLASHLRWSEADTLRVVASAMRSGLIEIESDQVTLTEPGHSRASAALSLDDAQV
jgi:manganese/zinc/iron transport system permease protein